MTSKIRLIITLCLLAAITSTPVFSRTISQTEAENAVEGWLNTDDVPMGDSIGWRIEWTDAYNDANGVCAYYIVYLEPAGFVIVAGNDLVEPIIGFVTGYAYYDPSPDNVLGAMVSRDLPARISTAENLERKINLNSRRENFTTKEIISRISSVRARIKWRQLQSATSSPLTQTLSVSDVRVPPLLGSTWGQNNAYGNYCYNYYTPNHYYDGCVATAMAQFMRYWQWPAAGIGAQSSRIYVSGSSQYATTRGGDGLGGPYDWNQMPLTPDNSLTNAQRQAIGALCYDTGVAAHMQYGANGSGAYMHDAKAALVNTFQYSNAVMAGNENANIGAGLNDMINPNLDSGNPVLLAIYNTNGAGHAIVADGYGYNAATLYHHLNLGWDGAANAWYNLPDVDTGYYTFNLVIACVYNIYTSGTGEIISGRITHGSDVPFAGATVTAEGPGGPYTAASNSNGIYALVNVQSNATYTITVTAPDCSFDSRTVTTGKSLDGQLTSGNKSGIDFVTGPSLPSTPLAPASIDYPTSNITGKYTVSWSASADATSYELMRSGDNGTSWVQVYAAASTSYSENVAAGSYRYLVRAMNGGVTSDWTAGTFNCAVTILPPAPQAPTAITYPAATSTGIFTVSWSASSGATSYQLQRSADGGKIWIQVYADAAASYTDTVATGTYNYRVKAVNSGGTSGWKTGTVKCVARVLPLPPELISYPDANSTGKYTVVWSASSGATQYKLECSKDGGNTWKQIRTTAGTSYAQKVATGNYRYRVRAVNKYGSSEPTTGTADCIVRIPPKAPVSISYPAYSTTGQYTVRWSRSNGATAYQLERSGDGGQTWSQVYYAGGTSYAETVDTGSYGYRVMAVSGNGLSGWRTKTLQCIVTIIGE